MWRKITITVIKSPNNSKQNPRIYTTDERQIVLLIHQTSINKTSTGQFMVDSLSTLNEVDLILFMVNVSEKNGARRSFIMERLQNVKTPVFLILNKLIKFIRWCCQLLKLIKWNEFAEIVPVSDYWK